MDGELRLELVLAHDWERIDQVREAVGRCALAVFADEDVKDALSMVAAELLENAMKYGSPQSDVRLAMSEQGGEISVVVRNAIDERSPHIRHLRERVEWLHGYSDPAVAYAEALSEIYSQGALADSGLGLVRIAYEGGCRIDCDLSQAGQVIVTAHRPRADGGDSR
jgi:hypothetical protein